MSKARKPFAETEAAPAVQRKWLFAIEPWRYRLLDDRRSAVIEAYVEAAGKREVIARIIQTEWIDADRTASFITDAVNALHAHDATVTELCNALELCLESDGLTWAAEIEAEAAIKRAKKVSQSAGSEERGSISAKG